MGWPEPRWNSQEGARITEFTEEQRVEIEKMIAEQRQQQMLEDYGKQFFYVALTYTAAMVNRGELPIEVHKMGQIFFDQFKGNTTKPDEQT